MTKPKTARSPLRSFTWGVRSTEVAFLQEVQPEPIGGCNDCGASPVRVINVKPKPARTMPANPRA